MYKENGELLKEKTYYSIGGGAVVSEDEINNDSSEENITFPYRFNSANELLKKCRENSLHVSTLMMENEKVFRSEDEVRKGLLEIWQVMKDCVEEGCNTTGELPKLGVKKRANAICNKLKSRDGFAMIDPLEVMDWINLWALAVNEQNACGQKVVTAPTNGVACSMASGALAEAMGGTIEQVENAAASARAVNAARMALNGDGSHFVSLDSVIKTMYETGKDMMSKYKETSQGGLAVNIVEC